MYQHRINESVFPKTKKKKKNKNKIKNQGASWLS